MEGGLSNRFCTVSDNFYIKLGRYICFGLCIDADRNIGPYINHIL